MIIFTCVFQGKKLTLCFHTRFKEEKRSYTNPNIYKSEIPLFKIPCQKIGKILPVWSFVCNKVQEDEMLSQEQRDRFHETSLQKYTYLLRNPWNRSLWSVCLFIFVLLGFSTYSQALRVCYHIAFALSCIMKRREGSVDKSRIHFVQKIPLLSFSW